MTDVLGPGARPAAALAEVPWLRSGCGKDEPAGVGVPGDQITTTLTSSGTAGQVPSRIYLDRDTARRQSRGLARS